VYLGLDAVVSSWEKLSSALECHILSGEAGASVMIASHAHEKFGVRRDALSRTNKQTDGRLGGWFMLKTSLLSPACKARFRYWLG
jgi:hypothetical protein